MVSSYTKYAQFNNATITVSNSSQLNNAVKQLANSNGGTVKVDANGGPYHLDIRGAGSASSPVLIESTGSGKAVFREATFKNADFMTLKGVQFDTSYQASRPEWDDDLRIELSSHIEIIDSSFQGSAKGYLSEGTSGDIRGTTGAHVSYSNEIKFIGNSFTNHMNTVQVINTRNAEFVENEITAWQGDAFHAGGVQNLIVAGNVMHDPLGSTQRMSHTDMIQIRSTNTAFANKNIEIAYNMLDSGGGPAAQGIHMGNAGTNARNENVSVHDNVVHSGLPRGIGIDSTDRLEVYNNTLLWDKDAYVEKYAGDTLKSWDPRILIGGSPNAVIEDNVATWIRSNGTHLNNGGYQIQYKNSGASNYAEKHFVDLDQSGGSYNLSMLASSPLYGKYGSELSWDNGAPTMVVTRSATSEPTTNSGSGSSNNVPEPASEASMPEVTLKLVNTQTDRVIGVLSPDDELAASYLGSRTVSIVAETSEPVGSVRLSLGNWTQTENAAPYALFGDQRGDYANAPTAPFAKAGDYSIKVELFSGRGASGKIGETSVDFSVKSSGQTTSANTPASTPAPVETAKDDDLPEVTLSLFNTRTDQAIREVEDGDALLSEGYLNSDRLSLVAELSEDVGSVRMSIGDWTHIENGAPYALFGNYDDDYVDATEPLFPKAGEYELTLEFFDAKQARNKFGETSIEFTVGDWQDVA